MISPSNSFSTDKLLLGVDIGSVSVKVAVVDSIGRIIREAYLRHHGRPLETAIGRLRVFREDLGADAFAGMGWTGSGGRLPASLLKLPYRNEIVALARGARALYPGAGSLLDIGGEDAKSVYFRDGDGGGEVEDFAMNTLCAAGTGSFIEQQAVRLGLPVEELGRLALRSPSPPRIAGRCSVFAKSDMIHLQQKGAAPADIVAGLCFALARNLKSNLAGGNRKISLPLLFLGGVAANHGMVRALREVFSLSEGELLVPGQHNYFGAAGVALLAGEEGGDFVFDLSPIEEYLNRPAGKSSTLPPLGRGSPSARAAAKNSLRSPEGGRCYLGVDIGSISTKAAVIAEDGQLVASTYLLTAGRPLEAVRSVMADLGKKVPAGVEILGAATTGSGRYLIGEFIGADVVKNEISAQARAAAFIDPAVDTIFEIGGQDSKYISLDGGAVVDFEMNKVCAAGTGSFLEEQAEKLGISIKDDFGALALSSSSPCPLGERCTVFMESDLVHHQQKGAPRSDLSAGLSYSIALNYLNLVVGNRRVGERIFFQGAVAFNDGVLAAFEKLLDKKVIVPPDPHVTGAVGAALWAREERRRRRFEASRFKGFSRIASASWKQDSFECAACANRCLIHRVEQEGGPALYAGGRCERYDHSGREASGKSAPDLFRERADILEDCLAPFLDVSGKETIGLPRALLFHELMPLWAAFFHSLGYRPVLSDPTVSETIRKGLDVSLSETCFPVKVALGHAINLAGKGVDRVFFPFMINGAPEEEGMADSLNCPYVQSFSHLARAALNLNGGKVNFLSPTIVFGWKKSFIHRSLMRLGRELGAPRRRTAAAAAAALRAQETFRERLRARGREVLDGLGPGRKALVVVSRPYNGYDSALNLDLPRHLARLGILGIPGEFLPLEETAIADSWPNMYWRYGQRILRAARYVRGRPGLYALYLTNFGCGPDSFILHFMREEMGDKPWLAIEVDEHSADVGAITRCEAFWDSVRALPARPPEEGRRLHSVSPASEEESPRKIFIPFLSDASHALAAAFRSTGRAAEVFPPSNEETLRWGRKYTSGKECYPCVVTTGDMLRIARSPGFDPSGSVFFMPSTSGPCRFGQYCHLQRLILDRAGLDRVGIMAPVQGEDFYREIGRLGPGFFRTAWRGVAVADILDRIRRERRPYEVERGSTDKIYRRALGKVCAAIENRGDIFSAFGSALELFDGQKLAAPGSRPLIGVVGEIFVRNHPFSNDYLVEKLEELGAEVWLPPVREWLWHINRTLALRSRILGQWGRWLSVALVGRVQHRDEKKLLRMAGPYLRNGFETSISEIWKNSSPYLPPWFGESALSVGKTVDFARHGVSGVINVMPFTCLPGNIFAGLLEPLRRDLDGLPAITLAYDGSQDTSRRLRLEAFVHQARLRQQSAGAAG